MAETLSDIDSMFDFEVPHSSSAKKRRKVIGLDDLLNDLEEGGKFNKKKSKAGKAQKFYASSDDEDETETKLHKVVDDFQKKIKEIDGQNDALEEHDTEYNIASWGLQVFGTQRTPSLPAVCELGGNMLLQTFMNSKLSSLVDLGPERGETFLRGLLQNGWLLRLVVKCGHIEKSIAIWTFNLLLYSSDESLRTSACDFWSDVLLHKEVDSPPVTIEWLPNYAELKRALECFGYLLFSPTDVSSEEHLIKSGSACGGPPSNIREWLKFSNACCQVRTRHPIFSISEAEELVGVIVCLFLDRRLQGLSMIIYECMLSAITFFSEDEWNTSCEKVAKSLAGRVPRDLNCLRMVECILVVDSRGKQLRSAVALHILKICFDEKITDAHDVLRLLISANMKDKSCDLFKTYLYLVLVDNWLISGTSANRPAIDESWSAFLRNCSTQITNTDFRPYAQEVRNRASYLLQGTSNGW